MVSAMWKIALFFTCLVALGAAAPGYLSAFPSLPGIYYYNFILISKCTDIKFKNTPEFRYLLERPLCVYIHT